MGRIEVSDPRRTMRWSSFSEVCFGWAEMGERLGEDLLCDDMQTKRDLSSTRVCVS